MRVALLALTVAAVTMPAASSATAAPARSEARSATVAKPCTPPTHGTSGQNVSPAVAATGQSEAAALVVYRGVGVSAGCLITARTGGGVLIDQLGIAENSAPAVTEIGGSTIKYQVAFQANTTALWTAGSLGTRNLRLGMGAGTSPSIVGLAGENGYQIAFQANTGVLWTTGLRGTHSLGLRMAHGTSPSIASVSGGYQIAYQGSNGNLWITNVLNVGTRLVAHDLRFGMMAGTSPSLAGMGNGYQVAFQANTGALGTYGSAGRGDLRYAMSRTTSPAIYRDGVSYFIAIETPTNQVYVVSDSAPTKVLPGTSVPGSSPAVTVVALRNSGNSGGHRGYGLEVAYAAPGSNGALTEHAYGVVNQTFIIP